ncbi:MAG: CoA transferase, partial [Ilumatobacteraceae bacterium]|nr:CoA transferase [Ilumatobacteraceae bacterium]
VNDYAAVAADPHNTINGYLHDIEHPEYGPMKIVVTPIELSDTPLEPSATAPELGQDTELVLIEAGYDWAAIGALRESGAI